MENSVSIGHIPPILEHIFVHLPISSLNKCARVCKLWNSMVKVEKRKRRDVFWMYKVNYHQQYHENTRNCPVCRAEKLAIGSHFLEVLKAAPSEPKLGIMFTSIDIEEEPHKYFTDCARVEPIDLEKYRTVQWFLHPPGYCKPFLEYISRYLPRDCNMIIFNVRGIIETPADGSQVNEVCGLTSLFFPAIPGLETFQFILSKDDADQINVIGNEDYISSITGIPKDKKLKCLLFFRSFGGETFELILKHYLQKQNYRLAVGGGEVRTVISPQKSNANTNGMTLGLAFAGEGIEVASVLLNVSVTTPEQYFEKLHDVKTHCKFSENCVAFMFSDSENSPPETQVEAFRRVFPGVPLFGAVLSVAFGNTFFSGINPEMDVHSHELYNMVFIILSWV